MKFLKIAAIFAVLFVGGIALDQVEVPLTTAQALFAGGLVSVGLYHVLKIHKED